MTIAIAWTRGEPPNEELVFITDSRLSGDGRTFDSCPKILKLPRPDCGIAFAGYTGHGYPMMQQLALAIEAHTPLMQCSLDLTILRSHALKIFNAMSSTITSGIKPSRPADSFPQAEFLFGGYSWEKKRFELWKVHFDGGMGAFKFTPALWTGFSPHLKIAVARQSQTAVEPFGRIAFAGDQASIAQTALKTKLASRPPGAVRLPLDWEPLEVVRDMLRSPAKSHTIGGPPQILKVYQYPHNEAIAVYWPDKASGVPCLQGRAILGYERIERFVIDPDTLLSEAPFVP